MPLVNMKTVTLGVNPETRCVAICEQQALGKTPPIPQQPHPSFAGFESGASPTRFWLRRCYVTPGGDLFIVDKMSTPVGGHILQPVDDEDDSNFVQRRVGDGHHFNWYLDSQPVLWDSNDDDGGIFLCKKDAEPSGWADPAAHNLPGGKGSQLLGLARSDGAHYVVFYVAADGTLHAVADGVDKTITWT